MDILSNPIFIFLIILLYLAIVVTFADARMKPYRLPSLQRKFGIVLFLLFCLFAVHDTDYFHYMESLRDMSLGDDSHFEPIYAEIAKLVKYDYILFRLVIWGSALVLLLLTTRRLRLPTDLVVYIFTLLFITRFSYARASLAMAVAFYGYSFIIQPHKSKIFSYLFGVIVSVCAYFFHYSALFLLPVCIVSLFKLTKFKIYILLILYPLLVYLLNTYGIEHIISGDEELDFIDKAQSYITSDTKEVGIAALIRIILVRTPYYLVFLSIAHSLIRNKYNQLNKTESSLVNLVFYIIYFASLFLFTTKFNTDVLYYRFLYYAIIPFSMILTIYKTRNEYMRLYKIIVSIGTTACLYEMLYSLYISIVT